MPPSPPLCKYSMPRRRAAALPRINECLSSVGLPIGFTSR